MKAKPTPKSANYPKPGETGGGLIRELISFLRTNADLAETGAGSIGSQILRGSGPVVLAVSGGSDSLALAHLLVHYGRKVVDRSRLRILHIDHGWRGAESEADAAYVERLAAEWVIPYTGAKLKKPKTGGRSLEDLARRQRLEVFEKQAADFILTAHTADDLAETLIWRLARGESLTHGGGIAVRYGRMFRPLLFARKERLTRYLKEEKVVWREDRTNHEGRFLRSKMRQSLMPEFERLFPRGVENLAELALQAQRRAQLLSEDLDASTLVGAEGLVGGVRDVMKMTTEPKTKQHSTHHKKGPVLLK